MKAANESLQINNKIRECLLGDYKKEFKRLKRNILADNVIHDPILIWNNTIIDGHLRYEIAQKHQLTFTTKELHFENEEEAMQYRARKQFDKRNSNDFQRAAITIKLFKTKFDKEAVLRMKAGKKDPLLNSTKGSTREKLAEIAGVSADTIRKVEIIINEAPPEIIDKAIIGAYSVNKAYNINKAIIRREDIERQKADINRLRLPDGLYDFINFDPPWEMEGVQYPTMSVSEIKEIKIRAKEDAVVTLWTVNSYLPDAFEILRVWGFEFKHLFVWNKVNPGNGYYAREQVEFYLLGIKGNPICNGRKYTDLIEELKREHSRKPDEFYKRAIDLYPGARLDYFARESHEGFDTFGNDEDKFKERKLNDDNTAPDVE